MLMMQERPGAANNHLGDNISIRNYIFIHVQCSKLISVVYD